MSTARPGATSEGGERALVAPHPRATGTSPPPVGKRPWEEGENHSGSPAPLVGREQVTDLVTVGDVVSPEMVADPHAHLTLVGVGTLGIAWAHQLPTLSGPGPHAAAGKHPRGCLPFPSGCDWRPLWGGAGTEAAARYLARPGGLVLRGPRGRDALTHLTFLAGTRHPRPPWGDPTPCSERGASGQLRPPPCLPSTLARPPGPRLPQ